MALIRDFTVDGVNYPQAYSRILVTRCDKDSAYVYVLTYASFDDRMAGANPVWTEEHATELATVSADVFPASYAFLKTLPEFAGAIDHDNPPEAPAPEAPTEPDLGLN
jgi:hypothetical protein